MFCLHCAGEIFVEKDNCFGVLFREGDVRGRDFLRGGLWGVFPDGMYPLFNFALPALLLSPLSQQLLSTF
jgi:hypothetical protein